MDVWLDDMNKQQMDKYQIKLKNQLEIPIGTLGT